MQAKIELLEKKIRAKDQLFEDAIASTMSGAYGGGSLESRTLTAELKKRVLELKTKNKEAEDEIERLTKTVKVVEVEVKEDSEPLRVEIQRLEDKNYELEQMIASQKDEIQGQRTRNEELDMQKNQTMLAEERVKSDLALTNERVRSLEEQLRSTKSDYQQS